MCFNVILIYGVLKSDQMLFKRHYSHQRNESYLSPDCNRDTQRYSLVSLYSQINELFALN